MTRYDIVMRGTYLLPFVKTESLDSIGEVPLKAKEHYDSARLHIPFMVVDHSGQKAWRIENDTSLSDSNEIFFRLVDDAYQGYVTTRDSDFAPSDTVDSIAATSIFSSGTNSYIILSRPNDTSTLNAIGFNDSSFSAAVSVSVNSVDSSETYFNPMFVADTTNEVLKRVAKDSEGRYQIVNAGADSQFGALTQDNFFFT